MAGIAHPFGQDATSAARPKKNWERMTTNRDGTLQFAPATVAARLTQGHRKMNGANINLAYFGSEPGPISMIWNSWKRSSFLCFGDWSSSKVPNEKGEREIGSSPWSSYLESIGIQLVAQLKHSMAKVAKSRQFSR